MNGRIAFFDSLLETGGVEKIMITYANTIVSLGYDVCFITARQGMLDSTVDKRIPIYYLNISRFRLKALFRLMKILRRENIENVFCANTLSFYPVVAKHFFKIKIKIVSSHHFYLHNAETPWYRRAGLKYIYEACDKVIAVSSGIAEVLSNELGLSPSKIVLLRNPIDINDILKKGHEHIDLSDENFIVWVGRINVVKNLQLLIKAFAELPIKYSDLKLLLVGSANGSEQEKIEELIKKKDLEVRVKILGPQTNPYAFMNASRLVAISSSSEAYPTVLLEALALGKTVVSTPTQGAKEILYEGAYGYISDDYSIPSYKEKLIEGLESPLPSEILVKEAYNSDKTIITRKLIDVFDTI